MPTAHVALGSNLGDRAATLARAVRRLRAEPGFRVLAASGFYETPPVGGPAGQGAYLNAALALESDRHAADLLATLHRIERQFGRVRTAVDGPRTLDLDLLLYGDEAHSSPTLTVPHPRLHLRGFVLVPLADIAPDVAHPTLKQTIRQLRDALPAEELATIRPFSSAVAVPQTLAGQQVLVTGSTSGIGLATANALRAAGARVLTHGRRPGDSPDHLAADLSDPAAVSRLAADAWRLSGEALDLLVCNAGADTLTGDAARWDFGRKLQELLRVDLEATMHLTRDLGGRMKERGHGAIITVGWDQAETGMEGESGQLFAAVKGAVMAFTRSLALSLAPEVRVNCVAPGWVRTAWGETAGPVWQERVRRETPLGVWGLPEDVAAACVWLADPAAAFLTGQTVRVNGGAVRV